jgi:hypothetical protein
LASCITERPIPAIPSPIRNHIKRVNHQKGRTLSIITIKGIKNKDSIKTVLKTITPLLFLEMLFSLKYPLTRFLRTFTNSGFEVSNFMVDELEITLKLLNYKSGRS